MLSSTGLHKNNKMVVISGIDPLSSPYEGGAHPSTPYHLTVMFYKLMTRVRNK